MTIHDIKPTGEGWPSRRDKNKVGKLAAKLGLEPDALKHISNPQVDLLNATMRSRGKWGLLTQILTGDDRLGLDEINENNNNNAIISAARLMIKIDEELDREPTERTAHIAPIAEQDKPPIVLNYGSFQVRLLPEPPDSDRNRLPKGI